MDAAGYLKTKPGSTATKRPRRVRLRRRRRPRLPPGGHRRRHRLHGRHRRRALPRAIIAERDGAPAASGLGVRALAAGGAGLGELAGGAGRAARVGRGHVGQRGAAASGAGTGSSPAGPAAASPDAGVPQPCRRRAGRVSPHCPCRRRRPRASPGSAAASLLEIPEPRGSSRSDRWPIEYVRRPQTLPGGMLGIALLASAFRPQDRIYIDGPRVPLTYHPHVAAGLSLGVGVTDLSEINLSLPRILCFDGGERPSGCSPYARYNGTGVDVEIGLVRDPGLQLEIQSGVLARVHVAARVPLVARDQPQAPRRRAGSRLRARVAIEQYANPPGDIANPLLAFVTGAADVQVTRRLLLYGHVVPWGSVADVARGSARALRRRLVLLHAPAPSSSLDAGTYNSSPCRPGAALYPGRSPAGLGPLVRLIGVRGGRRFVA